MNYLRQSLMKAYLAKIEDRRASKRVFAKVHHFMKGQNRRPDFCRPADPSLPSSAIKRAFAKNYFLMWILCDPSLGSSGPILSKFVRNDKKSYGKDDIGKL